MESPTDGRSRRRSMLLQVTVAALANLTVISPGMNLGFSAVALPAMQSANNTVTITEDDASWIASLSSIATPFGCLLAGPLLDRWGRRVVMLALNLPGLVGWIVLATAKDGSGFLAQVYVGRLLTGFSLGMASIPATVYIAEVAEQSLRGMLITWTSIFIALGILLVYMLGALLPQDWQIVAGLCAVLPVISAIVAWLLPESPVWLEGQGRAEEAEASYKRLRGVNMPRHQLEAQKESQQTSSPAVTLSDLLLPEMWKPLLILNIFFLFQQLSGVYVVVFYAIDIAREAGINTDEYLVSVLIGAIRFLCTIAVSYATVKFGRRPLSILSGVGMAICMIPLIVYLHLGVTDIVWIPAVALMLYILTSTIGFFTMPWTVLGEIFPLRFRGLAGGITSCCSYLFSFVIVKIYPDMKYALGSEGVFYFFGAAALIGSVFVWFCLPETQGKSLDEVKLLFTKKRDSRTTTSSQ